MWWHITFFRDYDMAKKKKVFKQGQSNNFQKWLAYFNPVSFKFIYNSTGI